MTDLVSTHCRCGVMVMISPGSSEEPLCMECRRTQAGIDWPWFEPLGVWHPTIGYTAPGQGDQRAMIKALERYPEPTIGAHEVDAGYLGKRSVMAMVALAGMCGWTYRVTHARGSFPHATTGTASKAKDSLAVRMHRGPERAVAVYVNTSADTWSWETLSRWEIGSGEFPDRLGNVTAFRALMP
jgi:hypothetical protein